MIFFSNDPGGIIRSRNHFPQYIVLYENYAVGFDTYVINMWDDEWISSERIGHHYRYGRIVDLNPTRLIKYSIRSTRSLIRAFFIRRDRVLWPGGTRRKRKNESIFLHRKIDNIIWRLRFVRRRMSKYHNRQHDGEWWKIRSTEYAIIILIIIIIIANRIRKQL